MKNIDATNDDSIYTPTSTHIYDPSSQNTELIRSDEEIQWYVDNLPSPPHGYRFSQRQRDEQYLFFKFKRDLITPSSHLDLYNATIVFVCMYDR